MKIMWGLMAEFETPDELLEATRRAHEYGYRNMDAYSPFPIPDMPEAIGFPRNAVPLMCLAGGIFGGGVVRAFSTWP